jgi:Mg-chelatase subunit ChlD
MPRGKIGCGLFVVAVLLSQGQSRGPGEILFRSNFSDLQQRWEVVDVPGGKKIPSHWRFGLTETSGMASKDKAPATALLGGDTTWKNYTVKTSLHAVSPRGNLVGILFGYQDQGRFYAVGYNFAQGRFELALRTPGSYELLGFLKIDFPERTDVPLRLDFAGGRIRFSANDSVIFDVNHDRLSAGRFGLGGSDLRGSKVLFGPVRVSALDPGTLPARALQDLLSQRRGGKLVSVSDQAVRDFADLIDHRVDLEKDERQEGDYLSLNLKKVALPVEGIFAFPGEKPVEIHKIGVQLSDRYFPGGVEFLAAEENAEGAFKSLGKFEVKPEKDSYQEFVLGPAKARFLKIRILSAPADGYVQLNEMYVLGFEEGSGATAGPVETSVSSGDGKELFREDFSSAGLEKWETWDAPGSSVKKSQWRVVASEFSGISNDLADPSTFLLTGDKSWTDYSIRTHLLAVQADGNLTGPLFGYLDADHYYLAGYNFSENRFELGERTPGGYEVIAFAEADHPRGRWFPLRLDVFKQRILFWHNDQLVFDINEPRPIRGRVGVATSGLNSGDISLSGFDVVSLASTSPPPLEAQDLLSFRRGGAVIYRESLPKSEQFRDMLDHDVFQKKSPGNTYDLDLNQDALPQEAVFCFPKGRYAEIRGIGFQLGRDDFPGEVEFWTSTQTPKSGFQPLTTITLEPKPGSFQEFPVGPARAKYLKIRVIKGSGAKRLSIPEMYVTGRFLERGAERAEEETLGEIALREKEPNNSIAAAQSLPMDTYLGGKADKTDVDFYKLELAGKPGNVLNLAVNYLGVLRPGYRLMTAEGAEIDPETVDTAGNTINLKYTLKPGDYYLRIDRPDSYLTIVYDDSGSMSGSVETVKRILAGYLDNLGEGLNLQLMKYTDAPVSLSGFTRDAAVLKQALVKEVKGGGGTQTFAGLRGAVDSVRKQTGNRAVLAIFDEIDCSEKDCLQSYIDLWDAILDSGISFSTIGVQSGWGDPTPYFGNSREQIFREIAFASHGEFFHSPSDASVAQSADRIFRQLTSPVEYRLRAQWVQTEKRPGSVEVAFEKGAEKKAAKNVELILDASNSMWGQIQGQAKIAIAKQVLNEIVEGLPQEMNVGLRLYGHRYKMQDGRACQDTELVVPIGPIEKAKLKAAVSSISPKGKTPLVHSVLEGIADFRGLKNGTVVLVSDGVESCDGDINSIAPALKEAGLDLQVNIVGFDIKEVEARQQLEAIAASTGGIYLDAKDSGQLLSSLEQTLQVEFVLVDAAGKIQARGTVGGEPVKVMEGTYIIRLLVSPQPVEQEVIVAPGRKEKFRLTRTDGTWKLQQ